MKLYEITDQHKELEKLAEDGDIDAQTIADTMEGIEGEFNDKAISLIHVTNIMTGDVDILDGEIKRLKARMDSIKNKQNSMREYLRFNMENSGITKITCPLFTITLAKGRDVVVVDDEDAIPTDYVEIDTVIKVDKKSLLKALKALPEGEKMEGCHITKSKSSLWIK